MRLAARHLLSLLCFAAVPVALLPAQQPVTVHTQVEIRSVGSSLAATLQALQAAPGPFWVGYRVPTIAPFQTGDAQGGVTYLERQDTYMRSDSSAHSPQDRTIILLRFAGGKLDQLRAVSSERTIDTGNLRLAWLPDVAPQDSVATLQRIAQAPGDKHLRSTATFLIAQHHSSAAMPALVALAAPSNPPDVREGAAFWMANARGHEGFVAVRQLARTDADPSLREKLTFDLTLSHDPGALPELVRMAHDDPAPHVRSQAQFWMAHQASKGDAELIATKLRQSTDNDPDEHVRKQAVFALSQLPGDKAVTQLIQVASTSHDPEVRKQAIFWLGQSSDPHALAYLTQLLSAAAPEPGRRP